MRVLVDTVEKDVAIARSEADKDKPLHRIWEGLVSVAVKIFENHQKDQVAARIPFSGSVDNPKVGLFATIVSVLRNAFIGAFSQSLEDSISLHDVRENLQDVRGEGDKDKSKDKQKDVEANASMSSRTARQKSH